tara:strand:- start:11086 stop:11406 length:321 start_codon:yes stop_codon:yes gene_type:complete
MFMTLFVVTLFIYPNESRAKGKMYESVAELGDKYEVLMTELRCVQCKAFHERMIHCVKYEDPRVCDEAVRAMDNISETYYGEVYELCYVENDTLCVDEPYPIPEDI